MRPDDQSGTGRVWHRRQRPRMHAFDYRLWYSLLDVDRLEQRFARSRWWSLERLNLVTFRRRDYLGDPDVALSTAVRDQVENELDIRPDGPVRMLTHLRQWGFCFNPVTFYFCHAADGALVAIVADVHNTPWDDRHAYVLDAREQTGPRYRFVFEKRFHVSPFLPMDLCYDWRFDYSLSSLSENQLIEPRPLENLPTENPSIDNPSVEAGVETVLNAEERLAVHMLVTERAGQCLAVGMKLVLKPLDSRSMVRMPLRFPLMALKVLGGIYWQALRLAVKRTPFHAHPETSGRLVVDPIAGARRGHDDHGSDGCHEKLYGNRNDKGHHAHDERYE